VSAGFPSPAEDTVAVGIDLNELLISHPAATFLVRASGTSMVDAGICAGDLLVVDRSLHPKSGSVVIAYYEDQFLVKRLTGSNGMLYLVAENKKSLFQPIKVTEAVLIWGVVSSVIKQL
jgi:DNA polymerase V